MTASVFHTCSWPVVLTGNTNQFTKRRVIDAALMNEHFQLNNIAVFCVWCDVIFNSFVFRCFYDSACCLCRFTCGSSMELDTLPSVLPWWVLRSWRCRSLTWAVTRTLTTTAETSFTCRLSRLTISNNLLNSSPERIFSLALQDFLWSSTASSTENIFIWQMKQYFDNDLYINCCFA